MSRAQLRFVLDEGQIVTGLRVFEAPQLRRHEGEEVTVIEGAGRQTVSVWSDGEYLCTAPRRGLAQCPVAIERRR